MKLLSINTVTKSFLSSRIEKILKQILVKGEGGGVETSPYDETGYKQVFIRFQMREKFENVPRYQQRLVLVMGMIIKLSTLQLQTILGFQLQTYCMPPLNFRASLRDIKIFSSAIQQKVVVKHFQKKKFMGSILRFFPLNFLIKFFPELL